VEKYIVDRLPAYMVPALWVSMESFPLTINGKVDRKALSEVDQTEQKSDKHIAPETDVELKLAEVWEDLLEVEKIGIHDDFFKLGGDSLLAIRLISAIRKKLEVEVDINYIFEYPHYSKAGRTSASGKQNFKASQH
jgi:acyl carrier protein